MTLFPTYKDQAVPLDIIKVAAHEGLTIVSKNYQTIKAIRAAAKEMGLELPQPISYYDFTRCAYPPKYEPKGFIIENVDILLQKHGDAPIIGCSFSK